MPSGPPSGTRRGGLALKIVPAVILAAVVLFGLTLVSDGSQLLSALRSFSPVYLVPALLLATANFLIRFVRWQFYLQRLGLRVPIPASAGVFFSGLSMAITPGKLGELVKCVMLRERAGAPPALTAPVVIAERFTDLAAVLLLVSLGIASYPSVRPLFIVGLLIVGTVFIVLVLSPKAVDFIGSTLSRSVFKGSSVSWVAESSVAFRTLLTGRALVGGLFLGVSAWFAECLALWLVLYGFGGGATVLEATFIYAVATLAGALSMLPGGLGATEASMAGLLVTVGVPLSVASAATLIIRACTLWWAELVGLLFYAAHATSARRALAELSSGEDT